MVNKCYFCDKAITGKIKIHDKNWTRMVEGIKVCSECFDKWVVGDNDYLIEKLNNTLGWVK